MLYFSNAFNTIDWDCNGVEPLTGMYIPSITVAEIQINDGLAPNYPFRIRFNQLEDRDFGFGVGWEPALSRLEISAKYGEMLVLKDGSRYPVAGVTGKNANLTYKKSNTFYVKSYGIYYAVIYKDGTEDFIDRYGNGLPSFTVGSDGFILGYNWNRTADVLLDIVDWLNGSKILCRITMENEKKSLKITNEPIRQKRIDYITLEATNNLSSLKSITSNIKVNGVPVTKKLYEFDYVSMGTYLRIARLSAPLFNNRLEEIVYKTYLLPYQLPAGVSYVSKISRYSGSAGDNQTKTSSEYTQNNYMGFEFVRSFGTWIKGYVDNLDNIDVGAEREENTLNFEIVETIDAKKQIKRTYNKYYLLLTEEITPLPGGAQVKEKRMIEYVYNLTTNGKIQNQSPTFHLPTQQKTHHTDTNGKTYTKTIIYAYDDFQNLKIRTENGIREEHIYYPAAGEKAGDKVLCPPNARGFIIYPKKKILHSRDTAGAKRKYYAYEYIGMYVAKTGQTLVLPVKESYFVEGDPVLPSDAPLHLVTYAYYEQLSNTEIGFAGLLKTALEEIGEKVNATPDDPSPNPRKKIGNYYKTTRTAYLRTLDSVNKQMTIEETIEDGQPAKGVAAQKTSLVKTYDLASGLVKKERHEDTKTGSTIEYNYDEFDRLIYKKYGKGSDTITYNDTLNAISLTRASSSNVVLEIQYDRMGRPIIERFKIKDPSREMVTLNRTYTPDGAILTESRQDYSMIKSAQGKVVDYLEYLRITATYTYNAFGDLIATTSDDAPSERISFDWERNEITYETETNEGKIVTEHNEFGDIRKKKKYKTKTDAIPYITEEFTHDIYGRIESTRKVDGTGKIIQQNVVYAYDEYNRLVSETGTLSGKKELIYSPLSKSNNTVKIVINGDIIEEYTYDPLGRETLFATNGLKREMSYIDSVLYASPKKVSIIEGRAFTYNYEPSLRTVISKIWDRETSTDTVRIQEKAEKVFVYDDKSGKLKNATATVLLSSTPFTGGHVNYPSRQIISTYEYDDFLHVTDEIVTLLSKDRDTNPQRPVETDIIQEVHYDRTVAGLPLMTTAGKYWNNDLRKYKVALTHDKRTGKLNKGEFFLHNTEVAVVDYAYQGKLMKSMTTIAVPRYFLQVEPHLFNMTKTTYTYDEFARIKKVTYGILARIELIEGSILPRPDTWQDLVSLELEYTPDDRVRVSRLTCHVNDSPTETAVDTYTYDTMGRLKEWVYSGQIPNHDAYKNDIVKEVYTYDKGKIKNTEITLLKGEGETEKPKPLITYYYVAPAHIHPDSISHLTIYPASADTPTRISFTYDKEGNTIHEMKEYADRKNQETSYFYGGEDNVFYLQFKDRNNFITHKLYFYDAKGRHSLLIGDYSLDKLNIDATIVEANVYADGNVIMEYTKPYPGNMNKKDVEHAVYYHRINGQVIGRTYLDVAEATKNTNYKGRTVLNLSKPDGSLLGVITAEPLVRDADSTGDDVRYTMKLELDILRQNPNGHSYVAKNYKIEKKVPVIFKAQSTPLLILAKVAIGSPSRFMHAFDTTRGSSVNLEPYNDARKTRFVWSFRQEADGFYSINLSGTTFFLGTLRSSMTSGTLLEITERAGNPTTTWILQKLANGKYNIRLGAHQDTFLHLNDNSLNIHDYDDTRKEDFEFDLQVVS